MHLLVTGGAGFIGSNFVRFVLNESAVSRVTVLDKLTYAGNINNFNDFHKDPRFSLVHGDICNLSLVLDLGREHDVIVNFAAETHVDRSTLGGAEFIQTNVAGTQTLLEAARLTQVETYIHVSTDEVYGSINHGSWVESNSLLPNSLYSASKASADLVVRAYHQTFGLDVRITRCSNNYGPYQFPEKLIPLFITNLIDGLPVPIYGNGLNVRDWLHVQDHCAGIWKVLVGGNAGDIYNIGGGKELSNIALTRKLLSILGKDESNYVKFVDDRPGHDFRYSVDWTKARSKLDFFPAIDFDIGLRETVNWYQSHEDWWRPLKDRLGQR